MPSNYICCAGPQFKNYKCCAKFAAWAVSDFMLVAFPGPHFTNYKFCAKFAAYAVSMCFRDMHMWATSIYTLARKCVHFMSRRFVAPS